MKKQLLSEEFTRMQKLAGIVNEIKAVSFHYPESFNVNDDGINFKWADQPSNPQRKLIDMESGEEFSKGEFWETDIIGFDPSLTSPYRGTRERDGTWTLKWDEGKISGFIAGQDFTL